MIMFNETRVDISPINNTRIPMENSNSYFTTNSQKNLADLIQIPFFVLIIIFAGIYITVVLSRRTLRVNKFNWLTVNVCLAGVIFAFIQLLSTIIRLVDISETIISCRSKAFIINMATCYIMYSHCIATLCRLLSVRYPHKLLFRSSRWLLSCIGISEIIGALLALPYLFFDGFSCSSSYGKRFLQIYTSLSTVLVPILIVTVCNIAIFRYVRQSSKRVHDQTNNNNNNANRFTNRDMYLCKIILLTFCVFVIGWTPLFIEQLFFSTTTGIPSGVSRFFKILPTICLFGDVLLLIYSDQPVRKLLIKAFKCHGIFPCFSKE